MATILQAKENTNNSGGCKKKMDEKFALKTKIMGADTKLYKELRVLSRKISWDEKGIKYEADDKYVPQAIKDMSMQHCKSMKTPGDKSSKGGAEIDAMKPLDYGTSKLHRSVVARCNYLAADRPDIQFATKEVAGGMANPTQGD